MAGLFYILSLQLINDIVIERIILFFQIHSIEN